MEDLNNQTTPTGQSFDDPIETVSNTTHTHSDGQSESETTTTENVAPTEETQGDPRFDGKSVEEMAEINKNAQRKITEQAQYITNLQRQIDEVRSFQQQQIQPNQPFQQHAETRPPLETPEERNNRLRQERLKMLEDPEAYRKQIQQEVLKEVQKEFKPVKWGQQRGTLRQQLSEVSDNDFTLIDQAIIQRAESEPALRDNPSGYDIAASLYLGEQIRRQKPNRTYQTTAKPNVEVPGATPPTKRYSPEAEEIAKRRGTKAEEEQRMLDAIKSKKSVSMD
jgi:hypothetical protein